MQIAHGSPPRHVEKCLRRRALRRQATSPGVIANRSGPAAREETNEVGHSWTGSRWSRTRRATGLLKPESALQLRPLLVVRGITIRAEATLSIIALLVMWSFWSLFMTTNSGVTVVATAVASTALFLGSILAQEIARARSETSRIERSRCHAARVWRGNRITSDIKRPCDEFALTIVGPWTSIVLGFDFGLGGVIGVIGEDRNLRRRRRAARLAVRDSWRLQSAPGSSARRRTPPRGNRLEVHPQSFASDGQVDSGGPDPRRTNHRLRSQRTRIRHRGLHRGQV